MLLPYFIVICNSTHFSAIVYIVVGTLGALALPNISENMLSSMLIGEFGIWIQFSASVFAVSIIGLGVPLFCVLMRLNLTGSEVCSTFMANVLVVILPWGTSWIFYNSTLTTALLAWGGMLFTSIVAFIAPLLLALRVAQQEKSFNYKPQLCDISCSSDPHQKEITKLNVMLFVAIIIVIVAIAGQFFGPT